MACVNKARILIAKIKNRGALGLLRSLVFFVCRKINVALYYVCKLFPIQKRMIVFESEGDLSDNSYALYNYMVKTDLLNQYKVAWLVEDVERAQRYAYKNTIFLNKNLNKISFKRTYSLATCKWYIYDHNNVFQNLKKRKSCVVINLWHGCGFKGVKGSDTSKYKTKPNYMIVTSRLFADLQSNAFGFPRNIFLDLGYPRNDFLFEENGFNRQKAIKRKLGINDKMRVFLWMPTFRKSINADLSENYFMSSTGLPLIDTLEKLKKFNSFLKERNYICLFKLHHLQAALGAFSEQYSNVQLVLDEDLAEKKIQLYEILPLTDCLISDYSSVTTDYLLLNKPLIYTLDDYKEYNASRGFITADPIKYFAGYHVKTEQQLLQAMSEIGTGNDIYKSDRGKITSDMHTHIDGKASERIFNLLLSQ